MSLYFKASGPVTDSSRSTIVYNVSSPLNSVQWTLTMLRKNLTKILFHGC